MIYDKVLKSFDEIKFLNLNFGDHFIYDQIKGKVAMKINTQKYYSAYNSIDINTGELFNLPMSARILKITYKDFVELKTLKMGEFFKYKDGDIYIKSDISKEDYKDTKYYNCINIKSGDRIELSEICDIEKTNIVISE